MNTFIGPDCPKDGREWDCQCARCGSSMSCQECEACGGEGVTALYEQDPLWYDPDDYEACAQCGGQGSWLLCGSSAEWCLFNPLPGRIEVERHTVEWVTLDVPVSVPEQHGYYGKPRMTDYTEG